MNNIATKSVIKVTPNLSKEVTEVVKVLTTGLYFKESKILFQNLYMTQNPEILQLQP